MRYWPIIIGIILFSFVPISIFSLDQVPVESSLPWWGWSLFLFIFCFALGIVAVIAGIGGGILYVPVVGAIFPFHLDFIRGAGLLVALAGSLSATPGLLRTGMASLRLAMPMALAGVMGSLLGAHIGLALPGPVIEIALGAIIFGIIVLMGLVKKTALPVFAESDSWTQLLAINGKYMDQVTGVEIQWSVHRFKQGLGIFVIIGFMAGMFGMGAGWANVPALNLVLGAPLKVAVATSMLIIAINGSAASWVYLNEAAILPVIAVPSVAGMMIGTRLGVRLLGRTQPAVIRKMVIGFLIIAGLRSLLSGMGLFE